MPRKEKSFSLNILDGQIPSDFCGHFLSTLRFSGALLRVDFTGDKSNFLVRGVNTPARILREADDTVPFKHKFSPIPIGLHLDFGVIESHHTLYPLKDGTLISNGDFGTPWIIDPKNFNAHTQVGSTKDWFKHKTSWIFPFIFHSGDNFSENDEEQYYSLQYNFRPSLKVDIIIDLLPKNMKSFAEQILSIKKADAHLVAWDGSKLNKWTVTDKKNRPIEKVGPIIHDLLTTDHFVTFINGGADGDLDHSGFESATSKVTNQAGRLFIVNKADLDPEKNSVTAKVHKLPPACFRLRGFSDNKNNILHLTSLHSPYNCFTFTKKDDVALISGAKMSPLEKNLLVTPPTKSSLLLVQIDINTGDKLSEKIIDLDEWHSVEITPSAKNNDEEKSIWISSIGFKPDTYVKRLHDVYIEDGHSADHPDHETPSTLLSFDVLKEKITHRYAFPLSYRLMSATSLLNSETEYLLCTLSHSDGKARRTEIWIFEAEKIEDGPICRLAHEDLDCLITHPIWLDKLQPYTGKYQVDVAEDYAEALAQHPEATQLYFKEVIFPSMKLDAEGRKALREQTQEKFDAMKGK